MQIQKENAGVDGSGLWMGLFYFLQELKSFFVLLSMQKSENCIDLDMNPHKERYFVLAGKYLLETVGNRGQFLTLESYVVVHEH